jgi:protein-tyrosine-phosphatase
MNGAVPAIRHLLFVCTGNICRSPMAEWLSRKFIRERRLPDFQVRSAGFIAVPGNPAAHLAALVAEEYGVDLSQHRAQPLTSSLIREADLILVMEPGHRWELLHRHREIASKVFLLRHFARSGDHHRAIADPYGLDMKAYRSCFEEIRECVESLWEWLTMFGSIAPAREPDPDRKA